MLARFWENMESVPGKSDAGRTSRNSMKKIDQIDCTCHNTLVSLMGCASE